MGILPPTNEQIDNYFKGGTTGLELLLVDYEQTKGLQQAPPFTRAGVWGGMQI